MSDDTTYPSGAPFNMAIATLMSLRNTLDKIRDIESKIEYPPEERQRIKIELVKRFFVDSCPLIKDSTAIDSFRKIIELKPKEIIAVNKSNLKQKKRIIYSYELNEEMDNYLLELQIELQKNKYFMPPSKDISYSVADMG